MKLQTLLNKITPIDPNFYIMAQKRLDDLTKPDGSLGRLEEFAKRLVAITEDIMPVLDKKVIFTFVGDHGVTDEKVSAYPKEVTKQMVFNFLRGGAGINVLARYAKAEVVVIDIGVDYDFVGATLAVAQDMEITNKRAGASPAPTGCRFISKKIVMGKKNMRNGP